MSNIINPLDILKRLDIKQNVTIRIIDEPTGKVVQEHVGHNAATNSLLTGIAHYLMGDGVLNQGKDTLSAWVPQYISLGTMGLTSQESENIGTDDAPVIVPADLGVTPAAPASATEEEKELNAQLRFTEYLNQTPGFGADGYDANSNNNREWFGLGYPYTLKPNVITQDFYDGGTDTFTLSNNILPTALKEEFIGNGVDRAFTFTKGTAAVITGALVNYTAVTNFSLNTATNQIVFTTAPVNRASIIVFYADVKSNIASVEVYPDGTIDEDIHNTQVTRSVLSVNDYTVSGLDTVVLRTASPELAPAGSRVAIRYAISSQDATNCELIKAEIVNNEIVPLTLRSKITYRDLVPEVQSEIPNTLDVIFSAFVSTGALKEFRGDRDYIYITEAGLWSKPEYSDSGDNGLLAGYRIMPSDDEVNTLGVETQFTSTGAAVYNLTDSQGQPLSIVSIDSITSDGIVIPSDYYSFNMEVGATTLSFDEDHIPESGAIIIMVYRSGDVSGTWKDMSILENRQKVQKSILRLGVNQVAQIIWKIQLGGLEQLNGLRYLYPSQYPEEVWELR